MGDACHDIEAMMQKQRLVKCTILPPKTLYHTVLPFRCRNKLLFFLCKSCAAELNTDSECTHDKAEQRALIGTWFIDEVKMAYRKEYEIISIHELYKYEVTQYVPQTGEGGIFVEYINRFLKLKAEASGYPTWLRTLEDEDFYIDDFYASEGVRLERDAIKPNVAKRGLAKSCLKSMWGKLTERNNRTKSKIISDPHELYRFLATPGIEVLNLVFASDKVVWLSWRFAQYKQVTCLRHTNEVINAYVTARAYLKLYSYLDKLLEKALYCDTDSVIYIQNKSEPELIRFTGTHTTFTYRCLLSDDLLPLRDRVGILRIYR